MESAEAVAPEGRGQGGVRQAGVGAAGATRRRALQRADDDPVFGFALPAGWRPRVHEEGRVVVVVQANVEALADLYTALGYRVFRGRAGYSVEHSPETLAQLRSASDVENARLFVSRGVGRLSELRFLNTPTAPRPSSHP